MAGKLDNPQPSPFIPLEDVDPSKFAFAVLLRAEAVTPTLLASLTAGETTYRQFSELPGAERGRVEEPAGTGKTLGDNWVYSHHSNGPGTLHTFTFVTKRSDVERQTAIPALSYTTSDLYPWPDVLQKLWFVEDPTQPYEVVVDGEVSYVPSLFRRMEFVEGGSYPTLFRVKVFVSHQPFPETAFALDVPVTGSVWWAMRNERGSIPRCLHPYIEFPESQANGNLYFGAGTIHENIAFGQKSVFPETNHLDWRDHVCYEHVAKVNGVWMLEQREAVVPRGRREIIDL